MGDRMLDEDTKRVVEMVRQGLQSDFWAWFRMQVQEESKMDILTLTDPDTPAEKVGFVRGKIRARNEDLLLPRQFLAAYDHTETAEPDLQDTPGEPRRLSPLVKEDDDVGQPDAGPEDGQPA